MLRLRFLAAGLALCCLSCTPAEQQLIDRFFRAVQSGEKNIASAMSLASFPGEVQSWEVVEVGPESREAFRLKELRQEAIDAQRAFDEEVEKNDAYLRENEKNFIEYRRRIDADPEYKFTRGPVAAFQEEWEKRMEHQKELQQKSTDAQAAYQRERDAAQKSVNVSVGDAFEGDVRVKRVKVNVSDADGSKTYTFTLRKYNLVNTEHNITPMANWLISAIEEPEA